MTRIPFLLVPGLNCTAEIFGQLVPALWPSGPVTIADHTVGGSIAEIAANILRDAPSRFGLLGFSLGGYIAFEILRQAPERVAKLCLLDTSARPDAPEATQKRRLGIERARGGDFVGVLREGFLTAVNDSNLGRDDLSAMLVRMGTTNGVETFVRQQKAIIVRQDSRPDLAGIKVPTLVIVGESDQTTVPAAAREMADGIAGARLVVIPKAGHMALVEHPELVNATVAAWARG